MGLSRETLRQLGVSGSYSYLEQECEPVFPGPCSPGESAYGPNWSLSDGIFAFNVSEMARDEDLNGDGDTDDEVVFVHDLVEDVTKNLKEALATEVSSSDCCRSHVIGVRGIWNRRVEFYVTDLDRTVDKVYDPDQDTLMTFPYRNHDPVWSGDLRLFFDASGLHVHDFSSGRTTSWNVVVASSSLYSTGPDSFITFVDESWQEVDLNDDGDTDDRILHYIDLRQIPRAPDFRRGDCNADGTVDIADPVANLGFQFVGSFDPPCRDALDVDDTGIIDVSDPIASLTHQFIGGPPPAPPGKEICGVDPTEDALTCESFAACPAGG